MPRYRYNPKTGEFEDLVILESSVEKIEKRTIIQPDIQQPIFKEVI